MLEVHNLYAMPSVSIKKLKNEPWYFPLLTFTDVEVFFPNPPTILTKNIVHINYLTI